MVKNITRFIPGINILAAYGILCLAKHRFYETKIFKNTAIPLDPAETFVCKGFKGKKRRAFIKGFMRDASIDRTFISDGTLRLKTDSLVSLSYTYDDVKQLSKATNKSYILGNVDGRNIAIVNAPYGLMLDFSKITFKDDHTPSSFNFYTEDEGKDKRFVVYPYINDKKLDVEARKIEEERILGHRRKDNETIQTFEPYIINENLSSIKEFVKTRK